MSSSVAGKSVRFAFGTREQLEEFKKKKKIKKVDIYIAEGEGVLYVVPAEEEEVKKKYINPFLDL